MRGAGQSQPPNHLSMFLEVTDPRMGGAEWSCFVSHRLTVVNQKTEDRAVAKESQNRCRLEQVAPTGWDGDGAAACTASFGGSRSCPVGAQLRPCAQGGRSRSLMLSVEAHVWGGCGLVALQQGTCGGGAGTRGQPRTGAGASS